MKPEANLEQQVAISPARLAKLRRFNFVMGIAHLVQSIAVVVLTNDFSLPVIGTFLVGPPGAGGVTVSPLFDVRIGWGVAGFLLLSGAAHLLVASPGINDWYNRNLAKRRNYARWIEYSISSSLMVVLIAMLTGIADAAALIAIFGVNASMILFGWLMEKYEEPGSTNWLAYWFGVFAGLFPWLAIGVYLWTPGSDASPPAFVYAIFVSLFIFFNTFAVNMVLQYRQVGKWRDYLYGERAYIWLSLIAKSALAWQVFGGTLAGG